ncbi:MAG TPA: hypothetical protein VH087_13580 [Thermoanaerobaculia bacterium]|nr:hypothetical protein [Thermoanaerobaculia bacterium]
MAVDGAGQAESTEERGSILREVILVGVLAVVFGVALMTWTVFNFKPNKIGGEWTEPVGELLIHLSVAGIVFGLFNMVIEIPDWSRYFERRLQNIVFKHGYLRSLNIDQLRVLWRRIIRAMFDSQVVDRPGTFADYFDRHLLADLGNPYRENVRGVMSYEEHGDFFFVHDFVSYVVRANRGVIQENVNWENDEDEFETVFDIRVAIRFPDGHARAGEQQILDSRRGTAERPLPKRVVVNCSLRDFAGIDGLIIEVESTYLVKKSRFQYWEMSTSTRDFSLTINHQDGYSIVFKAFVHDPLLTRIERLTRQFHFECGSWMLAHSGVAWRVEPSAATPSLKDFVSANPLLGAVPVTSEASLTDRSSATTAPV